MRETRARRLLMGESRRLALLVDVIDEDIVAGRSDADTPAASDLRGPTAGATTLEHEVQQSVRTAVDDELAEVAFALARLDSGTYGSCVACGDPIADERLEAVPATRFCVGCEATGEGRSGAAALPMVDSIMRTALREIQGWADDGPDEDDLVTPAPEEDAMHRTTTTSVRP